MVGTYRPEIDGLRAVAVLSVVVYHAGLASPWGKALPAGFLGVDVFFVISGYLISGIALREMDAGEWSILRFYERRARRILPALFVMVALTIPLALWMMSPAQLENYARSAVATVLFASNVFFYLDTSYFSEAIVLKPLAHTWSLGVEEQFYLLLPIALMTAFALRLRKHLWWLLLGAALVSLFAAEWASLTHPAASFYLLPFRGWELLAGSLLAMLEIKIARPTVGRLAGGLVAFGLAMVVVPCIWLDASAVHPGYVTLPTIVGTMIIIWFGAAPGPASWLLTLRPVVGIGLISYSLYLWHQPLFSFARIYSINDLTQVQRVVLCVASVCAAVLSWRYVERPFRSPKRLDGRSSGKPRLWLPAWFSCGQRQQFIGAVGHHGCRMSIDISPRSRRGTRTLPGKIA